MFSLQGSGTVILLKANRKQVGPHTGSVECALAMKRRAERLFGLGMDVDKIGVLLDKEYGDN